MIKTRKDAQRFFETVRELNYSYKYSNGQTVSANLFRENNILIHTVWAGGEYAKAPATADLIWQDSKAINKALTEFP